MKTRLAVITAALFVLISTQLPVAQTPIFTTAFTPAEFAARRAKVMDTIGDAVAIMNDKGYRNVPLVKSGKLIGSISVFDIISYLAESYPQTTMNLPPNPDQVMETTDGG